MDLNDAMKALAALNGAPHDDTDPFSIMPEEVRSIVLMYDGGRVNIEETVRFFFLQPTFICSDVPRFWELLIKDPEGYVIDVAKEFKTPIVTT